jgi:hypothetical protein
MDLKSEKNKIDLNNEEEEEETKHFKKINMLYAYSLYGF